MNPVQAAHPLGGFLDVSLRHALHLGLSGDPPGVVCLVVDDQDVAGGSHLVQHVTDVGLITFGAALIHAPLPAYLLVSLPVEGVPVAAISHHVQVSPT